MSFRKVRKLVNIPDEDSPLLGRREPPLPSSSPKLISPIIEDSEILTSSTSTMARRKEAAGGALGRYDGPDDDDDDDGGDDSDDSGLELDETWYTISQNYVNKREVHPTT